MDKLAILAFGTVLLSFVLLFLAQWKLKLSFTLAILISLVAGILVGIIFSGHTSWIMPIGKIYVTLLSAIVMPLIVVSILSSVTSLGGPAQLRGIGVRTILWLLATNAIAIILSLGLGLATSLGKGANLSIEGVDATTFDGVRRSFSEVLIGFFPRNFIDDIGGDKIIPVIIFSALLAVSFVLARHDNPKVEIFKDFIDALKEIIYKAVDFVILLTPYAVLALVGTATANGISRGGIIKSLLFMLVLAFVAFIIDTFFVNAVLIKSFAGILPWNFFRKIVPAQVTAFSTQSSVGTLSVSIPTAVKKLGVAEEVADFVLPLGTTIGMPGCAGIWPVLTAVYGVHGLGLHYTLADWAILGVVSLFVSIGTAGVPGTATIVTASVLTAAGLPLEIMVLTIPISAIADTGRTATNVSGALATSLIVAHEEGDLNEEIYYKKPSLQGAEGDKTINETPAS
jgi:Na+/H+-dicarboxylate symporter